MNDGVTLPVLGVQYPQCGARVLAQVVDNLKQRICTLDSKSQWYPKFFNDIILFIGSKTKGAFIKLLFGWFKLFDQ